MGKEKLMGGEGLFVTGFKFNQSDRGKEEEGWEREERTEQEQSKEEGMMHDIRTLLSSFTWIACHSLLSIFFLHSFFLSLLHLHCKVCRIIIMISCHSWGLFSHCPKCCYLFSFIGSWGRGGCYIKRLLPVVLREKKEGRVFIWYE